MTTVRHIGTSQSRGRGPDVGRGREAKELLRFGNLAGQGIGRIALALPSEGGLTHAGLALRRHSTSSDGSGDEGGVRTMSHRQRRWCGERGRATHTRGQSSRARACGQARGRPLGQSSRDREQRPWQGSHVQRHAEASRDGGGSTQDVRGSRIECSRWRSRVRNGVYTRIRWFRTRRDLCSVRRSRACGQSSSRASGQDGSGAGRVGGGGSGSGLRIPRNLRPGGGGERRERVEIGGVGRPAMAAGSAPARGGGGGWVGQGGNPRLLIPC